MSTMMTNHFPTTNGAVSSQRRRFSIRAAHQEAAVISHCPQTKKPPLTNTATRLAESLSNLLHLHIETPSKQNLHDYFSTSNSNFYDVEEKHSTPTTSPKEVIAEKWREIHGSNGWENLLDPLHPWLRREIVKYGEFAQATYDAFDFDSFSEYCGSCRYNAHKLFEKMGLGKNGYNVSKYIYAMSHIDFPNWLERSHLVDSWSKHSNWMGYVAVSGDEETRRIGRRDIVVAWRGTVAPSEWYEDLQRELEPIGNHDAKVEHGFLSIYTSKSEITRYNKSSASEQVMKEVKRLVEMYRAKGEEVSLTITGHSLGGALALLNAYEAAHAIPGLPISVISFGAPRVGNTAFRDKLHQMGVRTLRVVVKQDMVPRMPGLVLNESLQKFDEITGTLEWIYTHVGAELKLDVRSSSYLKRGFNLIGFHSLETYLHLVDGFLSTRATFRNNARRDVALVNKACDMLVDELRIPQCWYQLAHKGLVCNAHGRWVKPKREIEDIPSPVREAQQAHSLAVSLQSDNNVFQPVLSA
ncbi:phospholipase A1-Igamma1, chloroplastic-like [Morus notabilis]|uniref:phospholipase A1-Igamma1, chloroplastic-like n=1 Tax=Morus notabilis TaxID=981085 RepID=UPI000CED0D8B|nr:phospholipase A1-Igamma1, chloroplastic-like [Morus notabilis]XP_024021160.1 phospholipase A1-Igamma1, chloroplastic-like [Morus notabilis]XP_024022863.1 phospholipase A1-Igamma1, chloroplastic-like [Morus notabilis]XP_024025676.1 phospholipase A1-Igamma1, chloroplastic-like [Morus notabilis]XP_024025993.1 phospholipase A1-Igamma1, chloroplastic-like [Morus notabilis]